VSPTPHTPGGLSSNLTRGLIPPEVLKVCVDEAAHQYTEWAVWIRKAYDPNGDPITDDSGDFTVFLDPQEVPARQVTVNREFLDDEGYHVVEVTQWYIPPYTGVTYGDKFYGKYDDPTATPPIMSVTQVPDPNASIYELVTTGWRSKGAP
jgi:hypothetical protein